MVDRICAYCGRKYRAKSAKSRFCCSKCRVYFHRMQITGQRPQPRKTSPADGADLPRIELPAALPAPQARASTSRDSIARAVVQLKGAVSVLDAAATAGPEDCREGCRAVAEGVARVLAEVGL